MHLPAAFAVFVVLLNTALASYTNLSIPFQPYEDAHLVKRWYGVQTFHPPMLIGGWGAWPVMCPGPQQTQPVRYCFKNQRSATNLQTVLDQAIAKWAHAMLHSTLEIGVDHQGEGSEATLCSDPKVRPDALVISDETRDNDDQFNWEQCETQSTTGYNYASDARGRHTMEFCHLIPGSEATTGPAAVRAMMHELGHVIGLQHEHQRPDRGDYLAFRCRQLEGFAKGVLMDDDLDDADRTALICNDAAFAKPYFPGALPFIRGDYMDDQRGAHYVSSSRFDFDSIMIYNSDSGTATPNNPEEYVLVRRSDNSPVWMGGNRDPAQAGISQGDVARVAQLCPKPDGSSVETMDQGQWDVKASLRVRIRDVFEMVVSPPMGVAGSREDL